jgi:hypothetical protein
VGEECAHEVPNLGSCALRSLDTVQPIFYCDGLYLVERVISPPRKNPVLQIAFIGRSRRERFSPITITGQFLQRVMRNEYRNRSLPGSCLGGFLVSVDGGAAVEFQATPRLYIHAVAIDTEGAADRGLATLVDRKYRLAREPPYVLFLGSNGGNFDQRDSGTRGPQVHHYVGAIQPSVA